MYWPSPLEFYSTLVALPWKALQAFCQKAATMPYDCRHICTNGARVFKLLCSLSELSVYDPALTRKLCNNISAVLCLFCKAPVLECGIFLIRLNDFWAKIGMSDYMECEWHSVCLHPYRQDLRLPAVCIKLQIEERENRFQNLLIRM